MESLSLKDVKDRSHNLAILDYVRGLFLQMRRTYNCGHNVVLQTKDEIVKAMVKDEGMVGKDLTSAERIEEICTLLERNN
ncbi:unnamed protein product [Sphenostylis stenocarpa]|uniref:Uncharacterized protein n=1 Tax=Sphenostylis stenocarpa TaxID=92480 RepID=A0AA86S7D0_9FABA|nr:unnamed protein product [Sphenostylis stenocarpa]